MKHILSIDCPDESGLIFKITKSLCKFNLNIISNREFVTFDNSHFFMRTEFEGNFKKNLLIKTLKNELPLNSNIKLSEKKKKNIIVFASKEYHCLGDLIVKNEFDKLNANILAVLSNHIDLKNFVEKFSIPFYHIKHDVNSRENFEHEANQIIKSYKNVDYIILAKFMRILTADFVKKYKNRIINIHHSFLPAFIGSDPYEQAFKRGVKIVGATSHFVTSGLDEGPIIVQKVIPVSHTYNSEKMKIAGQEVEKNSLNRALELVFNEKVFIYKNKTIVFD